MKHFVFRNYLSVAIFFLFMASVLGGCDKEGEIPAPAPVAQASKGLQAPDVRKDVPLPQQIISYGKLPFTDALSALDLNRDKKMNAVDLKMLETQLNTKNRAGDLNHDGVVDTSDIDLLSLLVGNGSDLPIGMLDFNRDGMVNEDDYRLPATSPQTFLPFYSKKEARAMIASGARGYMYPVPATNLMYADLEAAYVWDVAIEIPGLQARKRNDGVWMLEQGDVSGYPMRLFISTPENVVSLTLSGDGLQAWTNGDVVIWGHFLWRFDGASFRMEGPATNTANTMGKARSFFEDVSILVLPSAFAEEPISPEIASQFNEYDAYVWDNNREFSSLLKRLTDDLKKKPECKTIDCHQLKILIADMDQLVDAASGSHALSVIAKKNAERIWEFQSHTVSAIKQGTDQVKRVLFWQKSALLAGDMAADLVDSLLTGNPTAIVDDMVNYAIGAGSDMVMSKSKFVASLSDSLGGMGLLSMENGKISFDPSSGSLDKVKNIHALLTAKSAADVRKAKLALTGMILKSIIKATTSSAVGETEKDLKHVLKALSQTKAFDRDMGMAVMLYANAERRLRKVLGRTQGQKQDIFSLLHDCKYQGRKKSCTTKLQANLDQAVSIRGKIEGDAIKQEEEKAAEVKSLERKAEDTLKNTKKLQQKKHAISEKIIEAIRATTLSNKEQIATIRKNHEAELKRLSAQQRAEWDKVKGIRNELEKQRKQLNALFQKNIQRRWQADDAYSKAVSDANTAFQKCLGSSMSGIAPMRKSVKNTSNAKDLIPPWLIYESFAKAQSYMMNKVRAVQLWKNDPDCKKNALVEPFNQISGCYYGVDIFSNNGRMILDVRGKSAQAKIQYVTEELVGWDNVHNREIPPVYTEHKATLSGTYKKPWAEFVHRVENESQTLKLRRNDKREIRDIQSRWYDSSYFELVGSMSSSTETPTDVKYARESPDLSSITVTQSDYKTPVKSAKNGDKVWITARSKRSCGVGRDRVFIQLQPASRSMACYPLSITLELDETAPGSGEYRSNTNGFTMKCMPESLLPGGWVKFSSFLNGENYAGAKKYRNKKASQVESQSFPIITPKGSVKRNP